LKRILGAKGVLVGVLNKKSLLLLLAKGKVSKSKWGVVMELNDDE
jgi:hypothetical protein